MRALLERDKGSKNVIIGSYSQRQRNDNDLDKFKAKEIGGWSGWSSLHGNHMKFFTDINGVDTIQHS